MIRPKPKPSNAPIRGGAMVVTAVLLVGVQLGLSGLALPAFGSGGDLIRELDPLLFERFATPAPPESPADTPDDTPAPEPEEPTAVSFDQEVGEAMEQLEELFAEGASTPPVSDRETAATPDGPGIDAQATDDRFESLFGATGEVVVGRAGRGRGNQPRGSDAGVGIGINERLSETDEPEESRSDDGPGVSVATGTDRPADEAPEVRIAEFSSESFDGTEADRLALWMRSTPGELPVGVRVHMNYQPEFLTSTTRLTSEGRNWELYLMFNESLRELHIVLVEDNRSVYLIDRGFQEQSRSLREGTVRRSGGEIVSVDSRTGIAGSDRAQDFYNVFLSWWEATKADGTP
ncbi:MAG: hypothetical protein AAF389_03235 [Gemmatimonadota bacterium]